ncbi:MAG: SRPBCC family protein [Candidatus Hodarchaeota archaeon]
MKTLKESIEINVPPENIWEWLLNFTDNYCEWHPSHIKSYWEEGEPNKIGSILYSEENIKGELLKMRSRVTDLILNKLYKFKTVGSLKLILIGGSFEIETSKNCSIFTATLDFRMGKFLSKVAKKTVGKIVQHMIEEGQNLKIILENL